MTISGVAMEMYQTLQNCASVGNLPIEQTRAHDMALLDSSCDVHCCRKFLGKNQQWSTKWRQLSEVKGGFVTGACTGWATKIAERTFLKPFIYIFTVGIFNEFSVHMRLIKRVLEVF